MSDFFSLTTMRCSEEEYMYMLYVWFFFCNSIGLKRGKEISIFTHVHWTCACVRNADETFTYINIYEEEFTEN